MLNGKKYSKLQINKVNGEKYRNYNSPPKYP